MDWLTFFWLVIVFYCGIAVGVAIVGFGNAARDDDPHNEPHGM